MNWILSIASMELRKILHYRFEFWANFFGQVILQLTITYFLWQAIFHHSPPSSEQQMSLDALFYYFLCANIGLRAMMGEGIGFISREIYDGGLTKYLLYPVDAIGLKSISYVMHSFTYIAQMFLILGISFLIRGVPAEFNLSFWSLFGGFVSFLMASFLFFSIAVCIELISFWADNIWSLMVILKFCTSFLGGTFVPIDFFPDWGKELVSYTPFPSMIHFPVRTLLGMHSWGDWTHGIVVMFFWFILFVGIGQLIWNKGQKKYTGVGI